MRKFLLCLAAVVGWFVLDLAVLGIEPGVAARKAVTSATAMGFYWMVFDSEWGRFWGWTP